MTSVERRDAGGPRRLTDGEGEHVASLLYGLFQSSRALVGSYLHDRATRGLALRVHAAIRVHANAFVGTLVGALPRGGADAARAKLERATTRLTDHIGVGEEADADVGTPGVASVSGRFEPLMRKTALMSFDVELRMRPVANDSALELQWQRLDRPLARLRQVQMMLDEVDRQKGPWTVLLDTRAAGWTYLHVTRDYLYADECAQRDARVREWIRMEYVDPVYETGPLEEFKLDAFIKGDEAIHPIRWMARSVPGAFRALRADGNDVTVEHLLTKKCYHLWAAAPDDLVEPGVVVFGRMVPGRQGEPWIMMPSARLATLDAEEVEAVQAALAEGARGGMSAGMAMELALSMAVDPTSRPEPVPPAASAEEARVILEQYDREEAEWEKEKPEDDPERPGATVAAWLEALRAMAI